MEPGELKGCASPEEIAARSRRPERTCAVPQNEPMARLLAVQWQSEGPHLPSRRWLRLTVRGPCLDRRHLLPRAMLKGASLQFDVRCNLCAGRRTRRVRYDLRLSKPV